MPKKPPRGKQLAFRAEFIDPKIYLIRGQKVMLDSDLAHLYEVLTKNLNLAVRRNPDRFPSDFMFQLTAKETKSLKLQIATANPTTRGGRRSPPYALTEHGIAMLSSVLRSKRAVQMNILIVRAFMKLREILATHKDIARAIEDILQRQHQQGDQIAAIMETINQLLLPEPVPEKRRIGFNPSTACGD